ncbi:winged helix-turn-helix transcriptional regulator [Agrobacterium sp. NPDC089420]|uniref:winged helix-turn-helix transcriptional regulator n=1 Tax=Agrobacterium sp. NPDC089420 TaxID=3363918 RepID=UPI00384CE75E
MPKPSDDCETSPNCGMGYSHGLAVTLRIIAGKWKPLILYFLLDGPKRYGELKRTIEGVSDKVLIQQLKELEADRVLTRTDYKEVPPRVDYALTDLGRSLAAAIVPLCTWGTRNRAEMEGIFADRDGLDDVVGG